MLSFFIFHVYFFLWTILFASTVWKRSEDLQTEKSYEVGSLHLLLFARETFAVKLTQERRVQHPNCITVCMDRIH